MNVPNETLDKWRAFAELVRGTSMSARMAYARGERETAKAQMQAMHDAAIVTAQSMERAGAERPASLPPSPAVPLALLDTPTNRRYLEALRVAWEAGLAVDRERYGADIGTDGEAQIIEMLIADKEQEIHGPSGVVKE